jgi:hypothetical protein
VISVSARMMRFVGERQLRTNKPFVSTKSKTSRADRALDVHGPVRVVCAARAFAN